MDPFLKFQEVGEAISGTKLSNMFGVKCFKVGRKPFISFFEDELVCKLFDEVREQALALSDTHLFTPMDPDKPMSNWVQIPIKHHEVWAEYAVLAHDFVINGR